MNVEQQSRLMELGVAWQKVDGRALDAKAEIGLRRKFVLARLEDALDQMHALAIDTEFVLVPGSYAGHPEKGYSQVSLGLKQAGHDYGWDDEQHLSFYLQEDGRVQVQRMVITRHSGPNRPHVPQTLESEVSYEEATVSWFIDRMLDFMAEKVANPRPSAAPTSRAGQGAERQALLPPGRSHHDTGLDPRRLNHLFSRRVGRLADSCPLVVSERCYCQ